MWLATIELVNDQLCCLNNRILKQYLSFTFFMMPAFDEKSRPMDPAAQIALFRSCSLGSTQNFGANPTNMNISNYTFTAIALVTIMLHRLAPAKLLRTFRWSSASQTLSFARTKDPVQIQ